MFQFIGYNFNRDGDALNNAISNVNDISSTTLSNAIFNHFNITRNTNLDYTTEIPSEWDYDTILDAKFNGNLSGGNSDVLADQISAIKIKRRVKGTFDWLTLKIIPVNSFEDLVFSFVDRLNAYGVEYEYAFVPVTSGTEGNYIINSILSNFKGVFIGDAESSYKFLYDVSYGSNARNQQVGTFQPLGRQYPVIVANGLLSYESGTVTATILNDDYEDTGTYDRTAIVQKKTVLKDFLTNRKAKILKDWNGNIWLCIITNNIQMNYKEGTGMGIPQVTFNWTQIGDADSQADLYANGIISEVE